MIKLSVRFNKRIVKGTLEIRFNKKCETIELLNKSAMKMITEVTDGW